MAEIFKDAIEESALAAARFETLGVVMRVVGNNSGYTGAQMEVFAQGLQNAGISMTESRQSLTRMVQAQLDLTESSKLARVAQDAAVIGNINSSEAFQRLVLGIQSGQVEILRTIGINIEFENSYTKVANKLGRTVESFSEAEKANIRMDATLEAGTKIAGSYTAAMDTVGKQIMSLPRHFENLKVIVGGLFTPALSEIIEMITKSVVDLNGELGGEGLNKIKEWGTSFRSSIIGVEAEFMRLAMLLDKFGGTWTEIKMLTYGPGRALGLEEDTKQFEAAADANMAYKASYEATSKELENLALKQIKLEESLTAAGQEAAREAELAAEKKRMAANGGALAAEAESRAAKKLSEEWAKTRRDLETDISKYGLNEFEQKIVEIQSKAQEFGIKYKDVATAQVDIERWASSQVAQVVMEAEKKRLEMARDSAVKCLEIEKDTVSGQISELEKLKLGYEAAYNEAINKAKEYEAAEAAAIKEYTKMQQNLATGFGTKTPSISEQASAARENINTLFDAANYSHDTEKIKDAAAAILDFNQKYKDLKDNIGQSIVGTGGAYVNQYRELTDQMKNLGETFGENKNKWQSFAESQKSAIEGVKGQIDGLKSKVEELNEQIKANKEIKIDTTAATAKIDSLQARINGLGSGAVSLGEGAGSAGNLSGTMVSVASQLQSAIHGSQIDPGSNRQAIASLTQLATSLGSAASSATNYSRSTEALVNENMAMLNSEVDNNGRMTELGARIYQNALDLINNPWTAAQEAELQRLTAVVAQQVREAASSFVPGDQWYQGQMPSSTVEYGPDVYGEYAGGTDYVPRTGKYILHQGESVVPADRNDGPRVKQNIINNFSQTINGVTDPMEMVRKTNNYMRQALNELSGRIRIMN